MTIDAMIAVLQAAKEGNNIECLLKDKPEIGWYPCVPIWDFNKWDYREAKPEPREIWIPTEGLHGNHDYVAFNFSEAECLRRNIGPVIHFREVPENEK